MHYPEFLHFRCPGHCQCRSSKLGGAGIWAVGENYPWLRLHGISYGRRVLHLTARILEDNIPFNWWFYAVFDKSGFSGCYTGGWREFCGLVSLLWLYGAGRLAFGLLKGACPRSAWSG